MKKKYLKLSLRLLAFLTIFLLSQYQLSAQTQGSRPNILLIVADDLGYADVGFNRDGTYPADRGIIPTPNIDALANQGIIATNAHVAHPFCGPSRASLMSGVYPHRIGAQYNLPNDITTTLGIPTSETYFSNLIDNASYNTMAVGKWHLGFAEGQYQPMDRGFDEFFGFLGGGKDYFQREYDNKWYKWKNDNPNHADEYNNPSMYNEPKGTVTNEYQDPLRRGRDYVDRKEFGLDEYLTDILTDQAIDFIDRKSGAADPFFMYLSYNAPHTPLQAPQAEIDAFKAANPDFENLIRNSPYITQSTPVTKLPADQQDSMINVLVEKRIIYATMVTNMDTNIGRVVDKLNLDGVMNNTLIVFLSDNGGYRFTKGAVNYPLESQKGSVDEGGHRVPFFVHWPAQITTPAAYEYPVSALDLYPTLVNLAGGTIPPAKTIDGVDIMDKLLAGENARPDEPLYVLRPQNGFHNASVVSYPYRMTKKGGGGSWKLFDVNTNPEVELTGTLDSVTTADAVKYELEDKAADWSREFIDVKPGWFDHDRNGGHPHRIHWFGEDLVGNTGPIIFADYAVTFDYASHPEGPTSDTVYISSTNLSYANGTPLVPGDSIPLGETISFSMDYTVPYDPANYELYLMQFGVFANDPNTVTWVKTNQHALTGGSNTITGTFVTATDNPNLGGVCISGDGYFRFRIYKNDVRFTPDIEQDFDVNWGEPVGGANPNYPLTDQSNSQGWVLNASMSDEFDGAALDENKWLIQGRNGEYRSNFVGRAPWQFSTNNVRLENGLLKIQSKYEPNYPWVNPGTDEYKYTTAGISTKQTFYEGYMEIKCKLPVEYVVGSFWTTGTPGTNAELDVFEAIGAGTRQNLMWSSLHDWSIPTPNDVWTETNTLPFSYSDGFHVYAAEWESDTIRLYADGQLIASTSKAWVEQNGANSTRWPMVAGQHVWVDSEIFPWWGEPDTTNLPVDYQVEYVRVWQKEQGPAVAGYDFEGPIDLGNGTYEDWYIPTGSEFSIVTERASEGVKSLKFTHSGALSANALAFAPQGTLQLDPGDFEMTAEVWVEGGSGSTTIRPILDNPWTELPVIDISNLATDQWVTVSLPFTHSSVSASNDRLRFLVRTTDTDAGSSTVFIDDVRFDTTTISIIPVTGIAVAPTSASLDVGSTTNLTVTIQPSDASNQSVNWSSDNSAVATVDNNGLVSAVAAGTAVITATSVDGGFTDSSTITVTEPLPQTPPIGSTIWLKADNGNYLTVGTGDYLEATASSVGTNEKFLVVDAGGGYIGLQSVFNNNYAVALNNGYRLRASTPNLGNGQKHTWEDVGTGEVALISKKSDKYWSRSGTEVYADGNSSGGAQTFIWGIGNGSSRFARGSDVSEVTTSFQIYPNPVKDGHLTISFSEVSANLVSIYDVGGAVLYKVQVINKSAVIINIDDLKLKSGIYFLSVEGVDTSEVQKFIVD